MSSFQQTLENAQKVLAKLQENIKATQSTSRKDDLLYANKGLLALFRKLQRDATLILEDKKKEASEARNKLDEMQEQLQSLEYKRTLYRSEIDRCRDLETKELNQLSIDTSLEREEIIKSIEEEHQKRKQLKEVLTKKKIELEEAKHTNLQLDSKFSSLSGVLASIEQATFPLQEICELDMTEQYHNLQEIQSLDAPLFSLYSAFASLKTKYPIELLIQDVLVEEEPLDSSEPRKKHKSSPNKVVILKIEPPDTQEIELEWVHEIFPVQIKFSLKENFIHVEAFCKNSKDSALLKRLSPKEPYPWAQYLGGIYKFSVPKTPVKAQEVLESLVESATIEAVKKKLEHSVFVKQWLPEVDRVLGTSMNTVQVEINGRTHTLEVEIPKLYPAEHPQVKVSEQVFEDITQELDKELSNYSSIHKAKEYLPRLLQEVLSRIKT